MKKTSNIYDIASFVFPPSNSDKVVKEVKERLLRAKGNPGPEKVNDVNVLCRMLKEVLRSLREPLLTFRMHKVFMKTSGQ